MLTSADRVYPRPNSAPAYYLGRPASLWMAVTGDSAASPAPVAERRWHVGLDVVVYSEHPDDG